VARQAPPGPMAPALHPDELIVAEPRRGLVLPAHRQAPPDRIVNSVNALIEAIDLWVSHCNDDPKPFVWTKTANEIIDKVKRGRAALNHPPNPRRTTNVLDVVRVDYSDSAEAYRRARTLPAEVLDVWRSAIEALEIPPARRVLDVGAGPGGFLDPLVDWFSAPVVAVEPSTAMRAAAQAAHLSGAFPYVAAWAEALPVRAASVDVAWLSTVVHQFDDPLAAARELRRIVAPGGRVLVRGFFSDVTVTGLLALFPGIERSATTFPSTDAVTSSFEHAGFALARVVDVVEPWRFDLEVWADRVRSIRHTDSALRPLTDAEVDDGLRIVRDLHGQTGSDETRSHATVPIASDMTIRLVVLAG
jgi:SAM-dependent methyltransferase